MILNFIFSLFLFVSWFCCIRAYLFNFILFLHNKRSRIPKNFGFEYMKGDPNRLKYLSVHVYINRFILDNFKEPRQYKQAKPHKVIRDIRVVEAVQHEVNWRVKIVVVADPVIHISQGCLDSGYKNLNWAEGECTHGYKPPFKPSFNDILIDTMSSTIISDYCDWDVNENAKRDSDFKAVGEVKYLIADENRPYTRLCFFPGVQFLIRENVDQL